MKFTRIIHISLILAGIFLQSVAVARENDTLAVIEKKAITSMQFEKLYRQKLITVGLSDNVESRMKYLQNLVDDEILIAHAKKNKIDKSTAAQSELSRIQIQELLNAFTSKHISGNLEVTENDLRSFFIDMNTRVKVRHLYAQTSEEADSLLKELSRGKTFEELAKRVFTDPILKNNGGSLGYISVDEMDPDFEKAAFRMEIGEISKPVKTVQGYSIIKVEDKKVNPLLTESEFARIKERLQTFVRKRKLEDAVKTYTATLRNKLKIKFNDALISKLFKIATENSLEMLGENPSKSILRSDLKRNIVTSSTQKWNVQKLIEVLSSVPERQRGWIKSNENFKDVIAGLMMRDFIVLHAKEERLDKTQHFRESVQKNFDTYLLTSIEQQLQQQITFSQDSLKSYYLTHKEYFTTEPEIRLSGILIDKKEVSDSVKSMLQNGSAFEETAKKYSIQSQTALNGGDLGFFSRKDVEALGKNIFELHKNEWTGPLSDDGKYLFLKCTEVKTSTYKAFKDCSKEIEETLRTTVWYGKKNTLIESFKNEIHCEVYPERVMTISLSLSN